MLSLCRDVWYHVTSYLQPMVRAAGVCWDEHRNAGSSSGLTRQPSLSLVGTPVPGLEASYPAPNVEMPSGPSTNGRSPASPWLTRLFARQPVDAGDKGLARL